MTPDGHKVETSGGIIRSTIRIFPLGIEGTTYQSSAYGVSRSALNEASPASYTHAINGNNNGIEEVNEVVMCMDTRRLLSHLELRYGALKSEFSPCVRLDDALEFLHRGYHRRGGGEVH